MKQVELPPALHPRGPPPPRCERSRSDPFKRGGERLAKSRARRDGAINAETEPAGAEAIAASTDSAAHRAERAGATRRQPRRTCPPGSAKHHGLVEQPRRRDPRGHRVQLLGSQRATQKLVALPACGWGLSDARGPPAPQKTSIPLSAHLRPVSTTCPRQLLDVGRARSWHVPAGASHGPVVPRLGPCPVLGFGDGGVPAALAPGSAQGAALARPPPCQKINGPIIQVNYL